MLSMNRATLVGHAGGDPEMRKLASGEDVARFSLATTERFTRRDDTAGQSTEWHSIVAFGAAAEAVRARVRKGDPVLVEGRIATRSWKDRTGSLRRTTEIVVAGPRGQINVLSRRSRNGDGGDDEPPGGAVSGSAGSRAEGAADATVAQGAESRDGAGADPGDEATKTGGDAGGAADAATACAADGSTAARSGGDD